MQWKWELRRNFSLFDRILVYFVLLVKEIKRRFQICFNSIFQMIPVYLLNVFWTAGCRYTAANHHCPSGFHVIDGKCMMVGMVQYTYSQAQVKMGWLVLKTFHLISPIFFVSAGTLALIHSLHPPLTLCQLFYPSCDRPCSVLLLFYIVFDRSLFSFVLVAMPLQCSPSLTHCQLI